MKAVILGAQVILTDGAEVVVAGDAESLTNVPHYPPSLLGGSKFGGASVTDGLMTIGTYCFDKLRYILSDVLTNKYYAHYFTYFFNFG